MAAPKGKIAASTQNQALNALVFLYKQVLGREELALENIARAKRPEHLPTVFDRSEIKRLFMHLEDTSKLVAALLYGAGLRLLECLRLRIQDIEFERSQIVVHNGKGAKDRVTLLPPDLDGVGNTCFSPKIPPSTRARARPGVITSVSRPSNAL
ncbi:tyrosine-type recombinase/integrase [Candidatus Thiosymbion oneisti]|uniref:tyrosine-type recombinase/integrase n=2 Tax=Candidatus Thiosymbion oneisti TaxID=589554 RepID=UPI00244506B5|nr:tyrosine-type recombinase/integrase [Candidatus Thiosymbion oneisti]